MKKTVFSIIILVISLSASFGQVDNDSITMKKVFGGYQFYQNNRRLNISQLSKTMLSNKQAYKEITDARSAYTLASGVSVASGFMIGYPIGTYIAGGDPEWALAGLGLGLLIVSYQFNKNFQKKARIAVDTYNNGLNTSSKPRNYFLNLEFTGNRIGLCLRF
ncbi:hypothetical protein ACFLRR_01305 [Bacteroidota bacterium]